MPVANQLYNPPPPTPHADLVLHRLLKESELVETHGRIFFIAPVDIELIDDICAASAAREDCEPDCEDACSAEDLEPEYHVGGPGDPEDAEIDDQYGTSSDASEQYECSPLFAVRS